MDPHFTSDAQTDTIEMDDIMVDYIGYVDKIIGPTAAANSAQVMRVVLNNNSQRQVQVVAWSKYISKLENVAILKNIIHLEGAASKAVSASSRYNDGNVQFQLEIKDHTMLNLIGIHKMPTLQNVITCVNFDTINNFHGLVKIEGAIKNKIRLLKTKYQSIGIGSITNGIKKLEIHMTHLAVETNVFDKGHVVSVIGHLVKRPNSPPYLLVQDTDAINLIKPEKESFFFLT